MHVDVLVSLHPPEVEARPVDKRGLHTARDRLLRSTSD
jgi:hypothetical protein